MGKGSRSTHNEKNGKRDSMIGKKKGDRSPSSVIVRMKKGPFGQKTKLGNLQERGEGVTEVGKKKNAQEQAKENTRETHHLRIRGVGVNLGKMRDEGGRGGETG